MKKITTHFLPFFLLFLLTAPLGLQAGENHSSFPEPAVNTPTLDLSEMDIEAFMALTPKAIKQARGAKVTLRERIVLRMAQNEVRKKLRKGEEVQLEALYKETASDFSFGGFLLGFFLGIIGVLIALLFGKKAVRSALYGMVTQLIIGLIAWVASRG
ncbi:MAG: hypothetical protein AAFR61_02830 [Bacteroidota bacterium]